jgi:hypothetical protein
MIEATYEFFLKMSLFKTNSRLYGENNSISLSFALGQTATIHGSVKKAKHF